MFKRLVILAAALALAPLRPAVAGQSAMGGAGQPAAPGGPVNDATGTAPPGTGTGGNGANPSEIGNSVGENGPGMGSGNNAANSPNNPGMDDGRPTPPTTSRPAPDNP